MAVAALSPLLNLLSTFLGEESALLGGLRHEVQHIKDEFGQMKGFLRRAEALAETSPEVEAWVNQVRDVAYDAEDVLDEFNLKFECHYDDTCLGRVREAWNWIMKLYACHQIATEIQAIKGRIKNISEAHQRYQTRYGISEQGSSSVFVHNQNTWYDRRGQALFLEEADLVGIGRPKKKLMNMLISETPELRVISVVGMGGLGKTTLVKKVYDDLDVKMRFKHHLWITVSQSFKIETLLNQAIQQLFDEVKQPRPTELDTMNANSMTQLVRDFLHQEDYVVVLDDIWRSIDWDAIRMAFPRNNCRCRIIITTRITDVGLAATSDIGGEIYLLEALNEEQSWTLFCKKAFRASSCPQHLEQISRSVLDKCDGLPLAIVVIGGVMARKSRRTEEWDLFNKSMGEQLVQNSELDNMIKLISLSYYDLPDHLRICFLYLSILPEDAHIEKTRLFRLWIAEGFVQKKEGMTMEEVAEDYLNELINRSLVQIAYTSSDGLMESCRVHDIIQLIILRKAREQGITTIISEQGMQIPNKVRRLVFHTSDDNIQFSSGLLKCLRSLILFESIGSMSMPFLSKLSFDDLRLLNVLELEGAPLEVIPDEIFKLLHLRYLGLSKTKVKTVPKSIGKLQKLETLDLQYTEVRELPVEILKLQQLRHLLLDEVEAPYKLGYLQSLESLHSIDADQMGDIKIVKEVGKLTQLRILGITGLRRENGKELCSSLERLSNLRSLSIIAAIDEEEVLDLQYSLSSTPRFLRILNLEGRLEKPPQWISSLQGLTTIHLTWSQLRDDPLPLLQDLPNLMDLRLSQAYEGEGLCFKAGGFQVLKSLWLAGLDELRWVRVENGSMPFLKRLWMWLCKSLEELPTGIEYLTKLQEVELLEMSDRLVNKLEDMDKQNADFDKIAHISQVLITNVVDDQWMQRKLSVGTKMAS